MQSRRSPDARARRLNASFTSGCQNIVAQTRAQLEIWAEARAEPLINFVLYTCFCRLHESASKIHEGDVGNRFVFSQLCILVLCLANQFARVNDECYWRYLLMNTSAGRASIADLVSTRTVQESGLSLFCPARWPDNSRLISSAEKWSDARGKTSDRLIRQFSRFTPYTLFIIHRDSRPREFLINRSVNLGKWKSTPKVELEWICILLEWKFSCIRLNRFIFILLTYILPFQG